MNSIIVSAGGDPREGNNSPSDIVHMPFHGRIIHTTLSANGEPVIVLKPTIEAIGLDFPTQLRKLKSRSWAVVGETPTTASDGKTYAMVTIDLETWSMLLANIDENKVNVGARDLVIAYQRESTKALRDYWMKGVALNPRYTLVEQAAVLAALAGVVDPGWLDAKGRQLAGRALGEVPEFDHATKPLTVSIYLAQMGMKGADVRKVAGKFGKALKDRYRARFGCEPPQMEDLVGRHMVFVAQYQERHRSLFDEVWRGINRESGGSSRPPTRHK